MVKTKETLRNEYVKCGKKGCRSCPHGPYWYAYWREGETVRKRYIGRELPQKEQKEQAAAQDQDDSVFTKGPHRLHVAYRILGINHDTSQDAAKQAYRSLAFKHHPDRGGDVRHSCRINEAWAVVRRERMW